MAYRTHSSGSAGLPREQNMDLLHEHDEMGPGAAPGGAHSAGPGAVAPKRSDASGIDKAAPREIGALPPSDHRTRAKLPQRPNVPGRNPGSR